jgi:hypothetical protein
MNTQKRLGRFTSSEIYNLTKKDRSGKKFGQAALTYIEEKNYERKLGRRLTEQISARPLEWGKLVEQRAFEVLGLEYQLVSDTTIEHSTMPDIWAGSPDGVKNGVVMDIKCPYTIKSFCQFYDINDKESLINNHKSGEQYYWQLVSNAILTNVDRAELIIYCPYKSELDIIRGMAKEQLIKWFDYAMDDELPYILDNGYYNHLKIINLEIPQEDKHYLTNCVIEASKLLIPLNS